MKKDQPQMWPSTDEYARWLDKNCTTCRYQKGGLPGLDKDMPCPLPFLALRALLRFEETPKAVIGIACRPTQHADQVNHPIAPHKCYSRRDNRGRPSKEEARP